MKSAVFIYNMHLLLWLKGKLIPIGYIVVMTICIAVPFHLGHIVCSLVGYIVVYEVQHLVHYQLLREITVIT